MSETILFTQEELDHLFPNKIQRDIFIAGMQRLIEIINSRTVKVPFVMLEGQSV